MDLELMRKWQLGFGEPFEIFKHLRGNESQIF